ncbi:hypothetical protein VNO80_19056 [Phaseolus coccineus]|uniref:Uncharacterized protein n=1 Tax=Phaseolus coccineus TaxID=3886 RepID=A0AAN9MGL3_PHACN
MDNQEIEDEYGMPSRELFSLLKKGAEAHKWRGLSSVVQCFRKDLRKLGKNWRKKLVLMQNYLSSNKQEEHKKSRVI